MRNEKNYPQLFSNSLSYRKLYIPIHLKETEGKETEGKETEGIQILIQVNLL